MPVLHACPLEFGILLGPALVGLALCLRDRRTWFLAAFGGAYAASTVAFFVVARYRLPIIPPMVVFAAQGFVSLWRFLEQRQWSRSLFVVGAASAISACAYIPLPENLAVEFLWPQGYRKAANAYLKANRYAEAQMYL